jgi:hypothetical protein
MLSYDIIPSAFHRSLNPSYSNCDLDFNFDFDFDFDLDLDLDLDLDFSSSHCKNQRKIILWNLLNSYRINKYIQPVCSFANYLPVSKWSSSSDMEELSVIDCHSANLRRIVAAWESSDSSWTKDILWSLTDLCANVAMPRGETRRNKAILVLTEWYSSCHSDACTSESWSIATFFWSKKENDSEHNNIWIHCNSNWNENQHQHQHQHQILNKSWNDNWTTAQCLFQLNC